MARPITTRETVRAQAPQSPNAPSLGVFAPLNVNAGPSDPLAGLGQALGVFTQIGGAVKKEREAEDDKQGYADAQLDQTDPERAAKSEKYADGVYRFAVLDQFGKAVQKVEQDAEAAGLEAMSPQERVAWRDARLKEELGPLAGDPQARTLIAERYTSYINQVGSRELSEVLESNRRLVFDGLQQDVAGTLASGTFDYSTHVNAAAAVVGRGEASGAVVEAIASHAEATNDLSVLDQIPASITTDDGQTIAGPRNTPRHRERIRQARDRIQRNLDEQAKTAAGKRRFEVLVGLDAMLDAGEEITPETFAQKGITVGEEPGNDLTPAQAANYIQASRAKRDAKKAEDDEWLLAKEAVRSVNGMWLDAENLTGGPKNKEEAQKFYNRDVKEMLVGLTGDESLVGGAAFGQAVVQDLTQNGGQGIAKLAFGMSAAQRLPYTPLKTWMSEVTPSAPKALLERLPAYAEAKAKNVAHLYVDDDAAALYEAAMAAKESGDDPAEVLRRYGDRDTAAYVSENFPKASIRGKNLTLDERGWNTELKNLGNRAYAEGKLDALIRTGLSRGLDQKQAQAFAKARFAETHEILEVGEKEWMLPRQAVGNPADAQGALDYFATDVVEAVQKKHGYDDVELRVSTANGRTPEFYLYSLMHGQVGSYFPLDGAVRVWKKHVPQEVRNTRVEAEKRARATRTRIEAFKSRPTTTPTVRRTGPG